MSTDAATPEIAAALGRFFTGGGGPAHKVLTQVFTAHGFGDVAPYIGGEPNKEDRVRRTIGQAKGSRRARGLVDELLGEMRVFGCFTADNTPKEVVGRAQHAFRRAGWKLDDDGTLTAIGLVDLDTGGRAALDEQIQRLRRSTDDPAQLLGSSKDLLEAVSKFVLEELDQMPDRRNPKFGELWYFGTGTTRPPTQTH